MNRLTHECGRDTSTLILLSYALTVTAELDYNILEKIGLIALSTLVIHSSTEFGTKLPDYDQKVEALPVRHKQFVTETWKKAYYNFCVMVSNRLKKMGATHRSWHTHSAFSYVVFFGLPAIGLATLFYFSKDILHYLLHLVFMGICVSSVIHVILDMYNFTGARWFPWQLEATNFIKNPYRAGIFKFDIRQFETMGRTGGDYEEFIKRKIIKINRRLVVLVLLIALPSLFGYSMLDLFWWGYEELAALDWKGIGQSLTEHIKGIFIEDLEESGDV